MLYVCQFHLDLLMTSCGLLSRFFWKWEAENVTVQLTQCNIEIHSLPKHFNKINFHTLHVIESDYAQILDG